MSSDPPRAIWFALLAPPVAWFAALTAGYFMVSWACGSAMGTAVLHSTLLACLLLGVAGALVAARAWRRGGGDWPGESPDPRTRTRFLTVIAGLGGILFSVAILWFWLATVVLDPCEPSPRLPFAPSAGLGKPAAAPPAPVLSAAALPVREPVLETAAWARGSPHRPLLPGGTAVHG